jgi:hypothetical protein
LSPERLEELTGAKRPPCIRAAAMARSGRNPRYLAAFVSGPTSGIMGVCPKSPAEHLTPAKNPGRSSSIGWPAFQPYRPSWRWLCDSMREVSREAPPSNRARARQFFDGHGLDEAVVHVPHIIAAIVNGTGCQLAALKHRQDNAKTSDQHPGAQCHRDQSFVLSFVQLFHADSIFHPACG